MKGNQHYGTARAERGYDTGRTEAILALAFEQRTANMLAAATAAWPNGSGMFPQISDGQRDEILKRLGLEV